MIASDRSFFGRSLLPFLPSLRRELRRRGARYLCLRLFHTILTITRRITDNQHASSATCSMNPCGSWKRKMASYQATGVQCHNMTSGSSVYSGGSLLSVSSGANVPHSKCCSHSGRIYCPQRMNNMFSSSQSYSFEVWLHVQDLLQLWRIKCALNLAGHYSSHLVTYHGAIVW